MIAPGTSSAQGLKCLFDACDTCVCLVIYTTRWLTQTASGATLLAEHTRILMMSIKALICLLPMLVACDFSVESEKPCRVTKQGWVCEDAGSITADAMITPDSSTTPDAALDLAPDLPAPIDMAKVEDAALEPDLPVVLPTAASCVEIRDRGLTTGIHSVVVGGVDTQVWCELDVEGGGWMLIGRSAADAQSTSFGWRTSTGTIANPASPYSLAVTDRPFTELLLGNMAAAQELGDRVYRIGAPDDFWTACVAGPCSVTVAVARGACTNVVMFNRMGFNERNDQFWFRDAVEGIPYGLLPSSISTYFDDCLGGEVDGQQGLLFIR